MELVERLQIGDNIDASLLASKQALTWTTSALKFCTISKKPELTFATRSPSPRSRAKSEKNT